MAKWATFIDTPHELRTRTPDGRDLVFLTGVAGAELTGAPGWARDDLLIPIGPFWRRLDNVAPVAALATVHGRPMQQKPSAWGTDNCRWANFNGQILLIVRIVAAEENADLIRVSYQATAIGLL